MEPYYILSDKPSSSIVREEIQLYKFVISELAKPIIRRIGTALSGTLIGLGYASDQAVQFETAATAFLLIVADLVLSNLNRRNEND